MASEGSVTRWIGEIKAGDEIAAQKLWERYFSKLVSLCRRRLSEHQRRAYDEEDVALSAFDSFCQGARKGSFPILRDRDNLWPLLVTIATRKAVDYVQHEHRQKRGGGEVLGESAMAGEHQSVEAWGMEQVIGDDPSPEFAAVVVEQYKRLMGCLEDATLQRIAQWKLEEYTNAEIAHRISCSPRTVARKLWLIRKTWSEKYLGNE